MESAILVIVLWIFSTCLHEFGHAITAYLGGDTTVKDRGYLTLNPLAYFNSATTLVLPMLMLLLGGIPLPGAAVYINTSRIRSPFWLSLTSFAGPFFSFLCLIAMIIAYKVISADTMAAALPTNILDILRPSFALLIFLETFVLILNLIPLPPLDGWGIIEPWLPENIQIAARRNGNLGFLLIMGLMWMFPPASRFMTRVSVDVAHMAGVPRHLVFDAFDNFREYSVPLAALIIVTFIVKNIKTPEQKAKEAEALAAAQATSPDSALSEGVNSTAERKTEI